MCGNHYAKVMQARVLCWDRRRRGVEVVEEAANRLPLRVHTGTVPAMDCGCDLVASDTEKAKGLGRRHGIGKKEQERERANVAVAGTRALEIQLASGCAHLGTMVLAKLPVNMLDSW